jgi:hypothetical protein
LHLHLHLHLQQPGISHSAVRRLLMQLYLQQLDSLSVASLSRSLQLSRLPLHQHQRPLASLLVPKRMSVPPRQLLLGSPLVRNLLIAPPLLLASASLPSLLKQQQRQH